MSSPSPEPTGNTTAVLVDDRTFVGRLSAHRDDVEAVSAIRTARRRRRFADRDWSDVAYRVYVTVIVTLFGLSQVAGVVGDEPLGERSQADLIRVAPAWVGLAVALVMVTGARSGCRGGPLAVESADAHHLFGAPRHRGVVLRRPAARMLGQGVAWGALMGGLTGDLAAERLSGSAVAWAAGGAFAGAVTGLAAMAIAMVAAGRRWRSATVTAVGAALVAWSALDAVLDVRTSPCTWLGRSVTWADSFSPWPLVWLPPVAVAAVVGIGRLGGVSVEAARRRTHLVGQLRFAVAQRDLRTVILLRRQLASDIPRSRPWFAVPRVVRRRAPVVARDLQALARWPLGRVIRVVALAVAAGVCLRGAWLGTAPLVVPAGGALFVAALDAVEPLAQEIDHPLLLWSFPVERGDVLVRHLVGPVLTMVAVAAIALLAALVPGPEAALAAGGAMLLVPAAVAAVAGAALSIVSEPVLSAENEAFIPPELAGPRVLVKTVWPVVVAVLGVLPVVLASRAADAGRPALGALATGTAISAVVSLLVVGWIWRRDAILASMTPPGGS